MPLPGNRPEWYRKPSPAAIMGGGQILAGGVINFAAGSGNGSASSPGLS